MKYSQFKIALILIATYQLHSCKIFAQKKLKLIEFGWDYPDVSQLAARLDSMQDTPFDGICFSLQRKIMEAFDTAVKSDDYFQLKIFPKLNWGKYSNNFIVLRGFSKTGANWFSDRAWINISKNMEGLSKAMQVGKISGIFFDPEYYYENPLFNPWTYSEEQYPGKTLIQVQDQVRKRGQQFINSLQKTKTSFTFLSIWIASLIAQEKKFTPIEKTRHVLLIPFIEGLLQKKNKSVVLVDGDEYGYWNIVPSQFFEASKLLHNTLLELFNSEKARLLVRDIKIAQPVFYDGLVATVPSFSRGLNTDQKWRWLNESIKYSLASTDEYVWFYSQHINWWKWKSNVNDTLIQMLKSNKYAFLQDNMTAYQNSTRGFSFVNRINRRDINNGEGYYYEIKNSENVVAFSYKWIPNLKKLNIEFKSEIPNSTAVYLNNQLVVQATPKDSTISFMINDFRSGILAIINKYERVDKESSALYLMK